MKFGSYIQLTDKLNEEYRKSFDFIEHYGNVHMVSFEKMAEKMMDLIDLMLEAQEKGQSPEEITGKNLEDFCKNYFSDVTVWDLLKSAAKKLKYWSWVVFILETLFMISEFSEENFNFLTCRSDVSGYMLGIMIALSGTLLADIVGGIAAHFGCYSQKIYIATAIIGTAASIIIALLFGFRFPNAEMPGYILIIGSALYLIIYYVAVFTLRYFETGCLKKTKSSYELSFTQMVKEELKGTDYSQDISIVKAFAKRYRKKNARLIKKGRKALTTEEYFDKNRKEVRYASSIGALSGILLMFCIGFIVSIITGEKMFETPLDVLGYIMINAVIWFLYIRFFKKIEKVSLLEQQSILKACQEQGMELDEYYNMLMKRE